MELGEKLRFARLEAGFTQRSLANSLGIGRNTLNLKINGKVPFNTKEVEEICEKAIEALKEVK